MAKERGDILSYELDVGFNLSVDKAIAGLGLVSGKIDYIKVQSTQLSKSFATSFATADYIGGFADLTKTIDKTGISLTNVADSVKLDVDLKKNYKLLEEQYELGEKINEQTELGNKFRLVGIDQAGSKLTTLLSTGIANGAGMVYKTVHDLANGIMNYFPRSPIKVGPLMSLFNGGMKLMGMLAQGIAAGAGAVYGAITKLVGFVASSLWGMVKWLAGKVFDALGKAYQALIEGAEAYHTANYRLYGSMEKLAAETLHTASTQGFLISSIQQATTALVANRISYQDLSGALGVTEVQFWKMTGTMAMVNRTTDLSFNTIANLTRIMVTNGRTADYITDKWRSYINVMRSAKLTTNELEQALNISPEQEWAFLGRFGKESRETLAELRLGLQAVAADAKLPAGAMDGIVNSMSKVMDDIRLGTLHGVRDATNVDELFAGMMNSAKQIKAMYGDTFDNVEMKQITGRFGFDKTEATKWVQMQTQFEKINEDRRRNGLAEIKTIAELRAHYDAAGASMSSLYDESKGFQYNIRILGDAITGTFGRAMLPFMKVAIVLLDKFSAKLTAKGPGGTSFLDRLATTMEKITVKLAPLMGRVFDAALVMVDKFLLLIDGALATVGSGGLFDAFIGGIEKYANKLFDKVASIFNWVMQLFPNSDAKRGPFSGLTKSGKTVLATFWDGISTTVSWFGDKLIGAFVPSGLASFVKSAFSNPLALIKSFLTGNMSDLIPNIMKGLVGGLDIKGMIANLLTGNPLADLMKGLVGGLDTKGMTTTLVSDVKGAVGTILDVLNGTVGKFMNVGLGWMDSLVEGLGFGNLKSEFKSVVGDVFKIMSPLGGVSSAGISSGLGNMLSGVLQGGVTDVVSKLVSGITIAPPDKQKVDQIISVKTQKHAETSSKKEATLADVVASIVDLKKTVAEKEEARKKDDSRTYATSLFDSAIITRW